MIASRLTARLLGFQLAGNAIAFLLTAAFAPRVLLLEDSATRAVLVVLAFVGTLSACSVVVFTFSSLRPLRSTFRALETSDAAVPATELLKLHDLPARLSVGTIIFDVAIALGTTLPFVRPHAVAPYAEFSLVLLLFTMVSTAALPTYVAMRASVSRVVELASPMSAQAALYALGGNAFGRVRKRFIASVAGPVAFVALGASLLVDAHARDNEQQLRAGDVSAMAKAAFTPLADGDVRGRSEAMHAAAALGYRVTMADPAREEPDAVTHQDGETQVRVPTGKGTVLVQFGSAPLSPVSAVYVLLAIAAVTLAAILGTRIGAAFDSDLALAMREVRRAGVEAVMRGTIIQHEARFLPVQTLLEAIDGLGGIFRQFAGAQQRAIDSSEANERMRGLLLASMSHDLKAPLNAVLGFAELVGRNSLSDGQKESLAIVEQRGRELLVLIDTILDSARVEAGELEVSPQATNVGDVVMSSVLEARDLTAGTDVQISGEIQPDIPPLFIDGTRIVQALTAVVMTAVRFSDKGIVPVRAILSDEGERLRIEVETHGEGLPMTEREKIFDAFKNAESARRHGGLGLGLQLARSIVEIHAGSIEVDSTPRGGMIFKVWLPIRTDRASICARASKPVTPDV